MSKYKKKNSGMYIPNQGEKNYKRYSLGWHESEEEIRQRIESEKNQKKLVFKKK